MIKYLKILTTSILLFPLWGSGGIFAQNFPVQCTPIVTPPYTLSWVEYGSSPERLKVQLLLKDLTKTSVEVSLRIRLKGIGVVIENTPDFYTSSPITLLPGVPVMLSGAMLRENFKYENLTAQGVDLEALYAGASLPSGFYQWEITAFLADQRQVSNVGMAMMTVFKNNPPQITFPQNNAVLMNTGFQSINFTWMPRHRYSTNAAAGTVYTFKIYEIPNEENSETDPNVIVNSGVLPLFSTQSFGTNYTYKPSDPLLVPGRQYVIQVQAADINGLDEFENNGLSEASTFSFGNPSEFPAPKLCKKPNNVLVDKLDEQSVQLTWMENNTEAPIDYIVNYKAENEGVWTERIVSEPSLMLVQLAPAKYQFKVSARCTYDNKSAFSNEETLELSKPVDEKEIPEAEPQDTYVNTDEPVTPPTTYEPETEPEPAIDPLNTPLRIILDPSENPSLPDTLKLPKGYENVGSLPVLGDKPTAEQLKEALKTKKPDCSALLANYQCGQNDIPIVPSGDIIQPNVGDEIAINSIAFEIVDLDGSGNGRGIVKVPMFNNAKFGVKFENIKVAKGGCVVSGQAILSDVDVALLSEEQRKKLAETYATFNKVLAIADSLAPEIAETYNSVSDFVQKFKQGLSNYVGGAKDAIVMKKQFKAAEKYADLLLKNKNLSDSTRNGLKAAYDEALATKDFFCSGKECQEGKANPKKGGPLGEFDYTVSLCEENKAKVAKLQDYLLKGAKETNAPPIHYHVSINMTTELWLDNEGKSFTKLYVDCSATEIKEWTYFDATLNKLTEGKIYPFASNSFYVNQSSYEASKLGMPMAGKWGDNIVSIASTYVDDFTFLGRVLEFCPNLTNEKEVKYPWHSLFLGAKNHSKSADFAENVKTISDVTYALVDGYYLVRGIAKIGLGALAKTGFSTILGKEEYFLIHQKLELELKNVITQYRKEVNIFRSVGNNNKVVGGTVASGKIRIDNIGEKMYVGASSTAQKSGLKVVQRYKATNIALVNHAEQDLLGKIANDLDNSLGAGSKNASGQIFLNIEQEMCTSCSAGLKNPRATSGIIKQFSTEYKNIVLIIDDSAKKVIVKNGTIIN